MTKNTNNRLQQGFVLILLAMIIIGFLGMIRHFLIAIVLAAIFSGLLYPLYSQLKNWLHGRQTIASILTLAIAILAIGLPLATIVGIVASEALQVSRQLKPILKQAFNTNQPIVEQLPDWLHFLEKLEPYRENIIEKLSEASQSIGSWLISSLSSATQDAFVFFVGLFVLFYAMFFFFVHGVSLLQSLKSILPLSKEDREMVLDRGLTVTQASLKGILLVGALQGLLVGLAFWASGLNGPAFWGAVVFVLSAIPGLGAPLIWLPAAIYLLSTGSPGWGIGLIVWGVFVVGLVDNLLRPIIIGHDAKLPDIIILVSILGGIATFGPVGLIIGPVIAAILDTVLNIYRRIFADQLPG